MVYTLGARAVLPIELRPPLCTILVYPLPEYTLPRNYHLTTIYASNRTDTHVSHRSEVTRLGRGMEVTKGPEGVVVEGIDGRSVQEAAESGARDCW